MSYRACVVIVLGTEALAFGQTLSSSLILPMSYTLRPNYVTAVRDQGSCGSCWAFGTYGALESSILKAGGPAMDFSENNLKNYAGFDYGPCDGGSVAMSVAYMSRLGGPVSEADDPYHPYDDRPSPGGPRQAFLTDASILDTRQEMKTAIMTTGALDTSMLWDAKYYRKSDYTYYCSAGGAYDHDVTIVGWDDLKRTAGGTGAWLIKNSWGSDWGNSGYFWLSYNDAVGGKFGVSLQAELNDPITGVHSYDDYGRMLALDSPYAMNVFHTNGAERLGAVSFYTAADGASYDLRIYDTLADGSPSGLLVEKTGTIDKMGYHVVDLDLPVSLDPNDDFAVWLRFVDGGDTPQAFDLRLGGYSSACVANAGESFYSYDGLTWTDLQEYNTTANFCIKAYTVPEPATIGLVLWGCLILAKRRRQGAITTKERGSET
jgi:C1A family cysteine protease